MAKYYISFGTSPGHLHTIGAVTTDPDHLYEIQAPDVSHARGVAWYLFGYRWAALRREEQARCALSRGDFKGIIRLDTGTVPCG